MKLNRLTTPSALLAVFTLVAAPLFAQGRGHGRRERSGQESNGRRAERAQPRSEAPRTQAPPPRVESRQQAPRAEAERQRQAPRAEAERQRQAPRAEAERQRQAPRAESRGDVNRREGFGRRDDNRREGFGRAVPRREVIVPRGGGYAPRYSPRYSPRVYGPRGYYRPYVFRPRISIGFGIFAGYPVPYSYSYAYPIPVYGYRAPAGPVVVTPGSPYYGGVALEITPFDAEVYVDGTYAGRVEDFDGTTQPLTLTAGTHRLEVQAPGYEPLVVDVGVQPGQVIPYRGDLQRN